MDQKHIRNFSIIAHIDHGKSTLADRILETTDTVEQREMREQLLGAMDLEQERGTTIKLNAVQLKYKVEDGQDYIFHLVGTSGHVDFTYGVSRSLAACEGAVLIVDATQGIEAQILANVYLTLDNDLGIIPVINKIDLPNTRPDVVRKEIKDVVGLNTGDTPLISAKNGLNIKDVPKAVVRNVPASSGSPHAPLQTLVFDSLYDIYHDVIACVRVKEGTLRVGDHIRFMTSDAEYEVLEVGIHNPKEVKKDVLGCNEVGQVYGSIKSIRDVRVGDTITHADHAANEPLHGYREMNPMIYCGLYPIDSSKYNDLWDALEKLQLNDASLQFEVETSQTLGFGFRCGFLGLLHMDVTQKRIEREYHIGLAATVPSVVYHAYLTDDSVLSIDNPSLLPDVQKIDHIEEPFIRTSIMTPNDYVGPIMELYQRRHGNYKGMVYIGKERTNMIYELPLGEIVLDFFDKLRSCAKGYASLDYELIGYRANKLTKMDTLLNGEIVDVLSSIVHREFAYPRGRAVYEKLKELIPRQQFEIPIQTAINGKIVAHTDIKSLRKSALTKCYGGNISRKKKLLEKQKEGKKHMKSVGSMEVLQEVFMTVLSADDDDKQTGRK